ncbi:hypothetical protein ACRAWG_37025 [Methylobacterium sp. P31]
MRGLCAFAVEREYLQADPARGVKLLGGSNDRNGFHSGLRRRSPDTRRAGRSAPASAWRSIACATPACAAATLPA